MQLLCNGQEHHKTQTIRWYFTCPNTHSPPPPPIKPTWESIYDPQILEHHILKQHHNHFSQADRAILTQEPLCTLVNDEYTSEYVKQILDGTVDIDSLLVDEYTKDLLKHLWKHMTTPRYWHYHSGFQNLAQKTLTSPLGWHLGTYKLLAKHSPPPKDKDQNDTPPKPPDPQQQWCPEVNHNDDGVSHYPYPHLQLLENNMDTAIRERSREPADWLTAHNPPIWSQLQLTSKVVLSQRVHSPQQENTMHQWQPRRRLARMQCHQPCHNQSILLWSCQYPPPMGNHCRQWCHCMLQLHDWSSQ